MNQGGDQHWPWYKQCFNSSPRWTKIAAILTDMYTCISLSENNIVPIQMSLKYVRKSPINNKAALVHVMTWRRTGDKPLPGPMMTQFIDAYMRY